MNDITRDDFEQRDRKNNKEQASDGTGKELLTFFDLFGVVASRHDLDGGGEHDDEGNSSGNPSEEGENLGGKSLSLKLHTAKTGLDALVTITQFGARSVYGDRRL